MSLRRLYRIVKDRFAPVECGNCAFPTDRLDDHARALVKRALRYERRGSVDAQIEALAPAAYCLISRSGLFVGMPKGRARDVAADHTYDEWSKAAVGILRILIRRMPRGLGENAMGMQVQAWSLAKQPYRLIEDIAAFMLRPNSPAAGCMAPWIEQLTARAEKVRGVEIELLPDQDAWPAWKDGPDDVMRQLFRGTPIGDMLRFWAPVTIPRRALHCHAHGMATTGAGKTTVNEAAILSYIGRVGMVVFDTKGGMAERLIRHSGRAGDIIEIDATSADMRPVFNIAQAPIGAPKDKVARMIQFILAGMSTGMTPLQFGLLEMIAKMAASIDNASLRTFINLCSSRDFVDQHFDAFPDDAKAWVRSQYDDRDIQTGLKGVERKLWTIDGSPTLKPFLCGARNTLDLGQMLDQKYLVIVTASKAKLQGDVNMVCRAIFAAYASAMYARRLPVARDKPDWLAVIDEAKDFVGTGDDSLVDDVLAQGREHRALMWMTHQHFSQIGKVADAVLTNTHVKFYANISKLDAGRLAPLMGCETGAMLNLPSDEAHGHFCLWINGYIQRGALARIAFGETQKRPKLDARSYAAVRAQYRQFWAMNNGDAAEASEGEIILPDGASAQPAPPSEHVALLEDRRDTDAVMPWLGGKNG